MRPPIFLDTRGMLEIEKAEVRMVFMKKTLIILIFLLLLLLLGCQSAAPVQVTATTLPVYEFTQWLCQGTDISVSCLITENVSCLHNYSLQVSQMRILEASEVVVLSGAGLEALWEDVLAEVPVLIDASNGISLLCAEHHHDHGHDSHDADHDHGVEADPHIWLSPANAKIMASNICAGLSGRYPEHQAIFEENLVSLTRQLDALEAYEKDSLSDLSCRQIITFHDGFSYLAADCDLEILAAIEEESGSEASASMLISLIRLIRENEIPAIFTETNGSNAAAETVAKETGIPIYTLDMAMSSGSYFEAMYHNIDTLKEALK